MSFPLINPFQQFFDSSGSPLVSGTIEFRNPNTNDLINSYPTADDADAQTNANANPLTLDANGAAASGLYLEDGVIYKIILKNSAGATVTTQDDVRCPVRAITKYGKTAQTLTDSGAVTLTESTTFLVTTGAAAITLADGTENQHKLIVMKTDGGAATLTPTNLSNGTTIVFDDVGDSASLYFVDGSWSFLGGTATVTGYTADTAVTFTSTDATPTVAGGKTFITAGTTAITDFDDGVVGQTIKILAASSITITHGSPISLAGSVNFNMVAGDTLTLHMFNDQVWEEIARTTADAKYESVTAFPNTLTAAESGTTYFLNLAGGGSTVLPAPALGLNYKFIVATAPTTAYTIDTNSGANIMHGTHLDIVGELVYGTARDILSFVANTSLVGDSCSVVSDGTSWFYEAYSGADGGITTGQT